MNIIEFISGNNPAPKRNKGKSLNEFPTDFCVVDLETTGLNPVYDEIIEVALLKVRDNKVIDSFTSLVRPETVYVDEDDDGNIIGEYYIDDFIVELTGITNEMLAEAPTLKENFEEILGFIDNDVIVGHNVNFDINFLYDFATDNYSKELSNDFWDLMKLSRRILKDIDRHRLIDLADFFGYTFTGHRALNDCQATLDIMTMLKSYANEHEIEYATLPRKKALNLKAIEATETEIDRENYFYDKSICFTGKLEHFTRKEAAQICVNLGAKCENSVTKHTNLLVLGGFDSVSNVKGNKSSKLKKAEKLILSGQDLVIMDEKLFLDTIHDL